MQLPLALLVLLSLAVQVDAVVDDRTALERFYETTDGARWTNNTGWKTSADVCDWHGIGCVFEKVTSINLPDNNLVGRVSKTVYKMETLEELQLKDNKLRSGSFDGFGEAGAGSDLMILNLAGNSLTDVQGISKAPAALRELHLTSNNIRGSFPLEVTKVGNLRELYLSFNKITGTLPTDIGSIATLEKLYTYGNYMTGTIPKQLGNLDKLEVLTLAENRFSGSIPTEVNKMLNLKTFSIHNRETGSGELTGKLPTFERAPYLNELYLDGNALTGSIPTRMLANSNVTDTLVTIGLSNNLLVGGIPKSFRKFSSLFIDIAGNQLAELDPVFCNKGAWMSGLVEEHGCDAIACHIGSYAPQSGRATDKENCTVCATNTQTLGATLCDGTSVTADWYVLAVLYRDLEGARWNATWPELGKRLESSTVEQFDGSDLDFCSWYGIKCDDTNHVMDIDLKNNGLVGTIPNEVFSLPKLIHLDLSKNAIHAKDLTAVATSDTLLSLSVAGTKIKSVKGIDNAQTLRELYLDGLELGGKFPTELYALSDLHKIHLQFSGLTGSLHTDIGKMKHLKQLNLYSNKLTGSLPSELGRLTDIDVFELSENAFTGQLPTDLALMTKLEKFHLHQSGGGLTGTLPTFDQYPLLKELSLDNNKLTGPIPIPFIQGIEDDAKTGAHILVSLTYNQLSGIVPKELSEFEDLDIRLEGNKISGIAGRLCNKSKWMNGQVGQLGDSCNAILCPDKTYNTFGKESVGTFAKCVDCPSAEFYGSVFCGDETNPNPEKTILDALYKATGGRFWKRATNWTDAGAPICHREGIICNGGDEDSGVTQIKLLDNGLQGTIPAEVYDLPLLRLMGFTNNAVDIVFDKIGSASELVVLKMSNTQVRSLDGLQNAPGKLTEIHLAGNKLTGSIPTSIFALNSVKNLFLNNNFFSGSISEKISDLTALEQIYLASNKLTGHIPTELGAMQKLADIYLEVNELSGNLPTQLENLSLLKNLNARGQKSDKKLSGHLLSFSNNDKIELLDLSQNDFAGSIPDDFLASVPVDTLLSVDLAFNRIGGTLPVSLKKFNALNIDLAENKIVRLFDDNCNVGDEWMGGVSGTVNSCSAILCIPGFAAPTGKQVNVNEPCVKCANLLVDSPFYGGTACKSHVEGNETEKSVLMELYKQTNGTSWIKRTNWNSEKSICSWFGVICGPKGVTELKLDSNGLKATSDVSKLLFSLRHLETLDIKGNIVPLDFTKLHTGNKLEIMKLSATGLKSLDGITNAADVRRLHITDNDLDGTFPSDLLKLTQLRSLYLSFNDFNGSLPSKMGDLSNLEEFYMYGNQITGSLPADEIAKMTNMREFIMANNYMTGTIPPIFNTLSSLEQLSLYDQQSDSLMSGTIPNFLGAPGMWYFDITGNDFTGTIPKDFMKNSKWFKNDVSVYLSNNELTGTVPTELNAFSVLDLQIIGNKITSLPNALCDTDNAKWMQGQVETFGCDAIACPPGSFNDQGRQDDSSNPCKSCAVLANDNRYGQTHCEDISQEKEILEALYFDTGGKDWSDKSSWTTAEPICSWKGILCEDGNTDDNGGVTAIDLEENNLKGTVPKSVWTLPFLRSFNVKHNAELSMNFDGLSAASSLELLYLSQVRIGTLRGVSQASNLRQLHITECGISGPMPDELFDLGATLDGIFMAYNAITGTLPTRFGELTQLESFYAFDNEFSGRIPSEIGMMAKLHRVVLAENLLTGPIPSEVSNLLNLQELSIFRRTKPGPKLTGPLPSFNKNPKLNDLYLDHNDITGKIPDDFLSASKEAKLVTLSFNRLEGLVPEPLKALPILNLQLEGNRITAFPPIFCNNSQWMDGDVGSVGCTSFLCPTGTASPIGRANATQPCDACNGASGAKYYGSISCDPAVRERSILLKFYQACGGTEWYNSDGWTVSDAHCNWYGVQCEGGQLGRVTALNLGSNNVVGVPPGDLFDLPELETLELFANPLNNFNFDNIFNAKRLTTLRLDSTGVSSLDGIGAAPALTFVDMRFNNLEGGFPEGVLELEHLRYLNLGNNKMTGKLPLGFFSGMPYLKTLRLGSNDFSGNVPAFHVSTGLTTIDLSNNKLSGTIADNFLDMKTTSVPIEIDLSGNQLTGRIPVELARFEDLTIYLRDNQFTGLPDDLCDNGNWNGGDVGQYGCDAILCPPGTFAFVGRARKDEQCIDCLDDGASYYGQVVCANPDLGASAAAILRLSVSTIAVTMAALLAW